MLHLENTNKMLQKAGMTESFYDLCPFNSKGQSAAAH